MQGRVPPNNIEAEQAVLGAMLLKPEAIAEASAILSGEDFYRPAHRLVFEAMVDLYRRNSLVDMVTVTEKLKKDGSLVEAGGIVGITALTNAVPTASGVVYYAKIVREKSKLRALIRAGAEITDLAFGDEELDVTLDMAEQRILKITSRDNVADIVPLKSIIMDAVGEIETRGAQQGEMTGLPSGFKQLDRMTNGFQASDLVLIAARPSMGKTAFVLNIATHVAVRSKQPVVFFSLEMSKEQLVQRMLASEAAVNSLKLRRGEVNDSEWGQLVDAADRLYEAPLFIDDTPGITVMEVRSKARRIKVERGLALVVLDYLQLMQGRSRRREDNRQQEISEISRQMKSIARELKVPVIALSQLSRGVESRASKRPMLSDLRESGSLEQDADIVMFLYREDYYAEKAAQQGQAQPPTSAAEVIISKHRNGPVGSVKMSFNKELTRFEEIDPTRQ